MKNKKDAIWLQGIGYVAAIPANEIKIGTKLMWNYGYTSTVLAITDKGKQSIEIIERYDANTINTFGGKSDYTRVLRKNRLVAAPSC
jgi:hypothetical protein